jgi:hypothetical protein
MDSFDAKVIVVTGNNYTTRTIVIIIFNILSTKLKEQIPGLVLQLRWIWLKEVFNQVVFHKIPILLK